MVAAASSDVGDAEEQQATLLSRQERDDAADLERGAPAGDGTVALQVRSMAGAVVCELRVARETPFAELKLFVARASGLHRAALQLALGPALLEDPTERPLLALGDEASEATLQLVRREGEKFRVDNVSMKSKKRGLKYHDAPITLPISARKATSNSRETGQVAKWGSSVFGILLEAPHQGWVRVGEKFLPIKVAGKIVLVPHKRAEQDERERVRGVAQEALQHLKWIMPCWGFLLVAIYPLAVLSIRYETATPNRVLWWFCWSTLPVAGYILASRLGRYLPALISPLKSSITSSSRTNRLHRWVARMFYVYAVVLFSLLLLGLYLLSMASFDDFALRKGRELTVKTNDTGLSSALSADSVALMTFPANTTYIPAGIGAVYRHQYSTPIGCNGSHCKWNCRWIKDHTGLHASCAASRIFLAAPVYRHSDVLLGEGKMGARPGAHPIAVVFQVQTEFRVADAVGVHPNASTPKALHWEACRSGRICGFLLDNDVVAARWAQWAPEMTIAGVLGSLRFPSDDRRHARELAAEVIAALHLGHEEKSLQGLPVLWLPPSTRQAVEDWDRRRARSAQARVPGIRCTALALALAGFEVAALLALVGRAGPKLRALAAGAPCRALRAAAGRTAPGGVTEV